MWQCHARDSLRHLIAGFRVEKATLGQVFLPLLRFAIASVIRTLVSVF